MGEADGLTQCDEINLELSSLDEFINLIPAGFLHSDSGDSTTGMCTKARFMKQMCQ